MIYLILYNYTSGYFWDGYTTPEEKPFEKGYQSNYIKVETHTAKILKHEHYHQRRDGNYNLVIEEAVDLPFSEWCKVGSEHKQEPLGTEQILYTRDVYIQGWFVDLTPEEFEEFKKEHKATVISMENCTVKFGQPLLALVIPRV